MYSLNFSGIKRCVKILARWGRFLNFAKTCEPVNIIRNSVGRNRRRDHSKENGALAG
jgi:hypothetical protein